MVGMTDNEQRTERTPPTGGSDQNRDDDSRSQDSDVPRAPAGSQDPPADPGEPMNPA
jgi:hypothetical protein